MVWPTLHFPIFLADWLGDSAIWCILSIKEIYQVFIQAYKPFTTSKTFKNFQSRAMWFDPYCPFKKKKKKIELRSICVLLIKTFIQKLYILSSILYKIPQKAPFIFFSIYTILEKLSHNTGLPIKKERSIFFKSTYGSNYVAFSDMSRNFRSRYHTILTILLFEELCISLDQKLFFLLQIFLKNTNQKQYGLTHNYPFTKTWPILSKAHVIRIALHLPKYLAKPRKHFSQGQYGLTQNVHLEKIDQIL